MKDDRRIVYKEEWVSTAKELLREATYEISETEEEINQAINELINTKQFLLLEARNESIGDISFQKSLEDVTEELKSNKLLLDNTIKQIEGYNDQNLINPITSSKEKTIKNGTNIAAIAGILGAATAVGASTLNEEKTEE